MSFNIKEWKKQFIEHLNEIVKNNLLNPQEVKEIINIYKDLSFDIQKFLESAWKITTGDNKEKIRKLYVNFLRDNAGDMVEKLRGLGYKFKKDSEDIEKKERRRETLTEEDKKKDYRGVIEAIENQAYRILEKTRLGLRNEVYHIILRIFYVNKKEFPPLLANAFNPVYSDELFKTFIYSFLSGILGEPKQQGGEGS